MAHREPIEKMSSSHKITHTKLKSLSPVVRSMTGPPDYEYRGPKDGPQHNVVGESSISLTYLESDNGYEYSILKQPLSDLQIGKRWANFELSNISNSVTEIEITAALSCNNGMVGMWLPTSDFHVPHTSVPQKSLEYRELNSGSSIFVDCKHWEFGKTGKLKLRLRPGVNPTDSIKFTVLARPIQETSNPFEIKFSVSLNEGPMVNKNFQFEPIGECSSESDSEMREIYQRFSEYGANRSKGDGNIVHPKQYITLRGMELIMDEWLPDNGKSSNLKLAYIGTDTTENLRSLLRWLDKKDHLEKIDQLTIFYTTAWDYDFMEHIGLLEEIKKAYPQCKIEGRDLSSYSAKNFGSKRKFDAIISTYVTPWADGSIDENNYVSFLKNAMDQDTFLLSVDPQNQFNSVRSELNQTSVNNDQIYKIKLGLQEAKSLVTRDNLSVAWSIWHKKQTGEDQVG